MPVPLTFTARLLGLRRGGHRTMLLPVRAAHTFGLAFPIRMVPITSDGVVHQSSIVPPRAIRRFGDAAWILEIPASFAPPPSGPRLTVVPSS